MKRFLSSLLIVSLVASPCLAFLGPVASQVTVTTNGYSNLQAGGTTLQGTLDWLDDHMLTDSGGFITEVATRAYYLSLTNNNTMAAGTTNSEANLTVRGHLSVETNLQVGAAAPVVLLSPASLTATNGATLTLNGASAIFVSYGSLSNGTNVVLLPAPVTANRLLVLGNAKASTNLLAVAASGTLDGPAIQLAPGEMAVLFASETNKWFALGQ